MHLHNKHYATDQEARFHKSVTWHRNGEHEGKTDPTLVSSSGRVLLSLSEGTNVTAGEWWAASVHWPHWATSFFHTLNSRRTQHVLQPLLAHSMCLITQGPQHSMCLNTQGTQHTPSATPHICRIAPAQHNVSFGLISFRKSSVLRLLPHTHYPLTF